MRSQARLMRVCLAIALLCLAQVGCQSAPIDSMTLFSLDGTFEGDVSKIEGEAFHGYPVLGKLEVDSASERYNVHHAILQGVEDEDGDGMKRCFWPRHGVRLSMNGKTVEYLICFECNQIHEYVDGEETWWKATSNTPAAELDKLLSAAGVPQKKPELPSED